MGKRLLSAYELATRRIIPSNYAEQREAERKREQADKEEVDALPDFIDAWERPDKGETAPSVMIEDNESSFYRKSQIEKKRKEDNKKLVEEAKYMTPIVEQERITAGAPPLEVHWYGHFSSYSGFSRLNRAMAFGLSNRNVKVKVDEQKSNVDINKATQDQLRFLSTLEIDPAAPKVFGATIPLRLAHGGKKILYTMMETSETLHQGYVDRINLYNEIWVPTQHGKDLFKKNGVRPEIYVMPLGVDTSRYHPNTKPMDFNFGLKDFVFLSVFKWGYRKGYDILLKAYMEEFSSSDDVSLLIVSRTDVNHKPEIIAQDFSYLRSGILKKDEDLPHIALFDKPVKEKDMPKIYAASDAFTLISRGEGFCTLPEAQIKTTAGIKEIKEIKKGDKVFSHRGYSKKVIETFSRDYEGEMINIKCYGRSNQLISLTPNHMVRALRLSGFSSTTKRKTLKNITYCVRQDRIKVHTNGHHNNKYDSVQLEWIKSEDLQKGDYLFYPSVKYSNNNFIKDDQILLNKIKIFQEKFIIEDNKIFKKGSNQTKKTFKTRLLFEQTHLNITNDLLKLMGYFVAEGCCSNNEVIFCFHSEETEYHKEVINLMKKVFNCSSFKNNFHKTKKSVRIVFQNIIASRFFTAMFGHGARNKQLPLFFFSLTNEQKYIFLYGLFNGDGCYSEKWKTSLSTGSTNLANNVFDLLFSLNIKSTIKNRILKGEKYYSIDITNIKDCNKFLENTLGDNPYKKISRRYQNRYMQYSNFQLLPIKSIDKENYHGKVYNIGVASDNSYICENIAVHNCLPMYEAAAAGLPIIGSNCSGQQDLLTEEGAYLVEPDQYTEARINGPMSKLAKHCGFYEDQIFPDFGRTAIEKTKEHMRSVYDDYESAQVKAAILAKRVREEFTWDMAIDKVHKRLKDIS